MKPILAAISLVLLVLVSACAQKVNDPADVQAIKDSVAAFAKAVNAGDAEGMSAMWADGAVYADNHVPVATGKEAIRSGNQGFLSAFKAEFSAPVEDVRVNGDLAVARGTWTIQLTPKAEGLAAISDGGSWLLMCTRQSDGTWKWDWCVPNSSQPLPGSTASGADEHALFQLERDWAAAAIKKDTAVVDRFLADGFVSNFEGRIQNKRQVLAEMNANPAKIESGQNSEMSAMVFGDTALVRGLFREKSTTGGKDTSQQVRYAEVYVKRDGRWQCVTQYVTRVP